MRQFSSLLLFLLALQLPTAAFAQSFQSPQSTQTSFDPVVYGLSADYREMPIFRTEKTLTFVKSNGEFVSIGAGSDLFTHDEFGNLVPIEEKGKKTKDSIVFNRLPRDIVVQFDRERPSYVYQKDNHWFRLSFAGTATAELEKPNVVRYRLADHAVLRFTVHGTTVSKAITIDGPIDPAVLQFSLETDADLLVDSAQSGMTLQDAHGATVFESSPPTLEDTDRNILDHPISIISLGDHTFAYEYDPTNLPEVYVIDPNTAYRTPVTVESSGAGDAWTGLSNIAASDNVYASATGRSNTQDLRATNFGFFIPDPDAAISGIEVSVVRSYLGSEHIEDYKAQIIKEGTLQGISYALEENPWKTEDVTVVYGGVGYLWGLTFDAASINANNFGFGFSAISFNNEMIDIIFRVDQIKMKIYGTLSAGYIEYLENLPGPFSGVCNENSLEQPQCWCGYCGELAVPPGISAVDAMDENIDMTTQVIVGGRLVRFKKGTTRIADVPIMFISDGPSCDTLTINADVDERQSLLHGIADYIVGTNSGYLLYVKKSVSDDHVRVCSGKEGMGCTSGDSWSFLANDQGTITETNGGFNTKDVTVSVADGYWSIFGLKETSGEGEDGGGGGGGGGAPVPEMPLVGLLAVSIGCLLFMRWHVSRAV